MSEINKENKKLQTNFGFFNEQLSIKTFKVLYSLELDILRAVSFLKIQLLCQNKRLKSTFSLRKRA